MVLYNHNIWLDASHNRTDENRNYLVLYYQNIWSYVTTIVGFILPDYLVLCYQNSWFYIARIFGWKPPTMLFVMQVVNLNKSSQKKMENYSFLYLEMSKIWSYSIEASYLCQIQCADESAELQIHRNLSQTINFALIITTRKARELGHFSSRE